MSKINPSEEIRKMLERIPQPKPKEIQMELAARGIEVNANLIKVVRHRWRKKKTSELDTSVERRGGYGDGSKRSSTASKIPEPQTFDYSDEEIEPPPQNIKDKRRLTPKEANEGRAKELEKRKKEDGGSEDKMQAANVEAEKLKDPPIEWGDDDPLLENTATPLEIIEFIEDYLTTAKKAKKQLISPNNWFEKAKQELSQAGGPFFR